MSASGRVGSPSTVSAVGSLPNSTITVPCSLIQLGLTAAQLQPCSSSSYGSYTGSQVISPDSGSSTSSNLRPYSPVSGSWYSQIIDASPSTQEITTIP